MLIVGNWKANGSFNELSTWAKDFENHNAQAVLSVPHPYLAEATKLLVGKAAVAAQDVADHTNGAHTGNTTATLVKDCGATFTLVGHSERRASGETDEQTVNKCIKAIDAELHPILCVGETIEEREAKQQEDVLARQLMVAIDCLKNEKEVYLAYEPVWAIGTGLAADPDYAQHTSEMIVSFVQETLVNARITVLYGGSVKPDNAASYTQMADIGGLLVGGASLDAASFSSICKACVE